MKVLTDELALQLTENLLQNDKTIKEELEEKIPNLEGLATETYVNETIANAQLGETDIDLSAYATKDYVDETINNIDVSVDLTGYAKTEDIPTELPASDVYDWAKAETKPSYTADEVGALPSTTTIPSIEGLATEDAVNVALEEKVDKVEGKELSTNDLTDELKSSYDNAVTQVHTHTDPLANKTILCLGDSLMSGRGWEGGYTNCIKEKHPTVEITNLAAEGAFLCPEGSSDNHIYGQFSWYKNHDGVEPDLIIMNGGGNDMLYRLNIGTGVLNNDEINGTYDTVCDALEFTLDQIISEYSNSKILYILPHPIKESGDSTAIPSNPARSVQREYYDAIEKILNKWSIPIADTYKNGLTSSMINSHVNYFENGDTVHLSEMGYRRVAPVIEDALNKIYIMDYNSNNNNGDNTEDNIETITRAEIEALFTTT